MRVRKSLAIAIAVLASCVRPADERAQLDKEVGRGQVGDLEVVVADGLAQIRELSPDEIVLWAQAPQFTMEVGSSELRSLRILVLNCMPGAVLQTNESAFPDSDERATECAFESEVAAGQSQLRIGVSDSDLVEPFRVAVMGDIQTGMASVDDVFDRIDQVEGVRFVISTGDLVENAKPDEYELLLKKYEALSVPYFSTIGNHELTSDPTQWFRLFGLYSFHFSFKGAAFSFVDSGNASIDPLIYDRLDGWLADNAGRVHLFGTHYPAFDPVGARGASFRSRREASKLLARLAEGEVDTTFYGHIHSFYSFENAGIPAYISGGGGAWEERFDGIGRHFLVVDIDPQSEEVLVSVARVD